MHNLVIYDLFLMCVERFFPIEEVREDSLHLINRLCRLHKQAIHVVFGLRKYDHVSAYQSRLGWLSHESTIQYRS